MRRRRFIALAAAFAATPAAASPVRWRGRALGAEAEITLHAPPALAAEALAQAQDLLAEIEALFSLHHPGSALARLNARGALTLRDRRFHALLDACDDLHRRTQGRFDPTVQTLWQALAAGHDPAAARRTIGWHRIARTPSRISLGPGQALTLNGIAQGYATDLIAEAFRALGLTQVLVHIGEFRALGGPWRIGIEDPAHGAVAARRIEGRAIATSGPAATLVGGTPHILDPSSPAPPLWSSVTVEAATATLADGLSTALCLADLPTIRAIHAQTPDAHRITLADPVGDITTVAR
ncbi:MAG: FAD:protein FMN transferase [Rhodobacter sp.]|nr:FAD:protein FMN transferase [Rhodobacter sp.]